MFMTDDCVIDRDKSAQNHLFISFPFPFPKFPFEK